MSDRLEVSVKNGKNYEIVIERNFELLKEEIEKLEITGKKICIITDSIVEPLYLDEVKNALGKLDKSVFTFKFKSGEESKTLDIVQQIYEFLIENKFERKDLLVALGGGVVGDMTGFVAATFLRGLDFIQIPTTLLSMVDSSVGGKTAIDMNGVKNIVGTFYQPKKVFININFLATLDKRQFMSGIGEILKYAFIEQNCGYKHSLFMFEYLTLCCEKLLKQETMTLMKVIEYCLNLKIAVVNQDEKETDLRKVLNLGHTLGHALEVLGNYKKFLHGEAVVQGMFFVLNYSYTQGLITYSYYRLATELLNKYGFKTLNNKYKPLDLVEVMKHDKKAIQDKITFIVPCEKKKVKEIKLSIDEVLEILK